MTAPASWCSSHPPQKFPFSRYGRCWVVAMQTDFLPPPWPKLRPPPAGQPSGKTEVGRSVEKERPEGRVGRAAVNSGLFRNPPPRFFPESRRDPLGLSRGLVYPKGAEGGGRAFSGGHCLEPSSHARTLRAPPPQKKCYFPFKEKSVCLFCRLPPQLTPEQTPFQLLCLSSSSCQNSCHLLEGCQLSPSGRAHLQLRFFFFFQNEQLGLFARAQTERSVSFPAPSPSHPQKRTFWPPQP